MPEHRRADALRPLKHTPAQEVRPGSPQMGEMDGDVLVSLLDGSERGVLDLGGVALVRGAGADRALLCGGRVPAVVVADPAADDARHARVRSVVREGAVVRGRDAAEEGDCEWECGDGGENAGGTDACHVVPPEPVHEVRLLPGKSA